ncbi:hypothetical protein N5C55_01415 [Pseudomonas otitidis]|uniref:hypothetical protein n=1 Tax=Metapseudomonas otitidis TaxID=319939 RepID=UPI00244B974E|nr:hypothetical protein [Pseudomonas otitidis]MDH1109998.1 hypothetical protein [Pseudomonas otitidis]MDH1156823.1 hypothetical protein [Pseudomonas otitidis]MDH1163296.1 hypothetical protein [Pseudomonas otitidis]
MPAQRDLTGDRFGELTVIRRDGSAVYGRPCAAWLCECDCGRREVVAQIALARGKITACYHCRRPDCIVCAGKVPAHRPRSNTCSEACARTKKRKQWLAYYHAAVARDPEFNRNRHLRTLARMAADPALAERIRAIHRAANARWRQDPANREALRRYSAAYWVENRETIIAARRARLDAMTPEQLQHWLHRMRQHSRAWATRYRARMRDDPNLHAQYLENLREYRRRRAQASQHGQG